ncbi:hypothetical protein F511_45216 [Dorcoceras hygrometricum]|uniref:Uncharacterized protein n=1 Tax=Dorcoceras hygrometricum TaxID=472368 RepID=A0A2Z6ZWR4_9LAMI|nr:hypothetical protein F511_45216 [Dorcoceras hygrometricum]
MAGDTLRASSRAGRATRTLVAAPLDSPGANRCAAGRDVRPPSCYCCMSRPDVVTRAGRVSWAMAGRSTMHEMARRRGAAARCDGRTLATEAGHWLRDAVACWLRASALAAQSCARRRAPPCEIFRGGSGEFPAMS